MADTSTLVGCDQCLKSTLSLLLLRPSPVPTDTRLGPPGADRVRADPGVLVGVVPSREPTQSRWALRLLREGFVHVHLPSPPPGVKPWLTFRVTANADLIPEDNPVFDMQPYAPCTKREHNAEGMKLLPLPKPHLMLGPIWIAYSPNRWNATLRSRNAGNPKAMVQVNLAGGSANTFKPSADKLRAQVLECALPNMRFLEDKSPDFEFTPMSGATTDSLVEHLQRAAARHPRTVNKELAVVLRDPVGVTTELNALRLLRHEFTKHALSRSPDAHPAASLLMLRGLREKVIESLDLEKKAEDVAPVMSRGAFEDIMRVRPNPRGWDEDASWQPLQSREDIARHGYGKGRVIPSDLDERIERWKLEQSAATWAKYDACIDQGRLESWLAGFRERVKQQHGIDQRQMEEDWWSSRQDVQFDDVFALHFDENEPNEPFSAWCPGEVYAHECLRALTPQPLSDDASIVDRYIADFERDVNLQTAVLLRAVVANQKTVFDKLAAHVDKKDDDGLAKSREDKLADLAGALVKIGADKAEAMHPTMVKYRWVSSMVYAGAAMAIAQSAAAAWAAKKLMTGAAVGGALGAAGGAVGGANKSGLMGHVVGFFDRPKKLAGAVMQVFLVRESAVSGTGLRVAMRVSAEFTLEEAALILARREGAATAQAVRQKEQQLRGRKSKKHRRTIKLELMSDSHEVARFKGNLHDAFTRANASVAVAGAAGAQTLPDLALDIAGSKAMVQQVLAAQPQKIDLAARHARDMMAAWRGVYSLDGAIGVMALLINGMQFWSNLGELQKSLSDPLTWANTADSFFGTIAGAAQITDAMVSASITTRLGQKVAEKSLTLAGMRVVASGAGAAGGIALTVGEFIKAYRAQQAGDVGAGRTYAGATVMFGGFTAASWAIFSGAVADFMILRGSQAAVWQFIAARVGARALAGGVIRVLGIGIPGWGWIFLGAGLAFEGLAIALTPDELQKHLRKSFFGTSTDRFKTLEEETKSLEAMRGPTLPVPVPVPDNVAQLENERGVA